MNGDHVGIKSAGIYLEKVREGQHLSRLDAAQRATIVRDENYVWKVERARIHASATYLADLTNAVQGSFEHIKTLLLGGDDPAAAAAARGLARDRIEELNNPPSPEEIRAKEIIEKLKGHADLLQQFNGYGDSLVDIALRRHQHP